MNHRVFEWRGGPTSRRMMASSKDQASSSVLTTSTPSHLLVGRETGHVLVIGSSRTHKTSGVIVPTMLGWSGAQLVVAGDMAVLNAYEYLEDEQRSLHREICIDPTDERSARWNPLTSLRDGALGLCDATRLVDALISLEPGRQNNDVVHVSTKHLLLALILYAREHSDWSLSTCHCLLGDPHALLARLSHTGLIEDLMVRSQVHRIAEFVGSASDQARGEWVMQARTILAPFIDADMARISSGVSDFTLEELLDPSSSLRVLVRMTRRFDGSLFRCDNPLGELLLASITSRLSDEQDRARPHLLIVVDDVANVGMHARLTPLVRGARSSCARVCLVAHDLGQLAALSDKPGELLEHIESLVVTQQNRAHEALALASQITRRSPLTHEANPGASELMELEPNEHLICRWGQAPVCAVATPYFDD